MAETDGLREGKNFFIDEPMEPQTYPLRGCSHLDWGMKDRLSRIFNPASGKTVMLAFDHGYIMGPTSGLERIDKTILPLAPLADVLMCTRGVLRSTVPPTYNKGIALRCSAGATLLRELSDETVGVAVEDAIRLNASAMAVQVYIGEEYEHKTIANLVKLIDAGTRYGIPTLAVTAVGKTMGRDAKYLGLATRVCAEIGAQFVKTYFCEEGFENVVAACPIPLVIAGGKKIPELDALTMAYKAIDQGALGVDMGRNIFQADAPVAMLKAVRAVVHEGLKPQEALDMYETLKNEG